MSSDRVTLTVPARSEFAKTVRMTASSLASRIDTMSYDDVEDVRMAAEEAFVYAVDTLAEGDDVRFDFIVDDDSLTLEVPLGTEKSGEGDDNDQAAGYAIFILESVCDSYEFVTGENGRLLRLVKHAGSSDAQ